MSYDSLEAGWLSEHMSVWYQKDAIDLCVWLESIAPQFGYHVALTGGCLYSEDVGRKDLDIVFYSIRQNDNPDRKGLVVALEALAFGNMHKFGWMYKANYKGKSIDFFFPEEPKTEEDGSSTPALEDRPLEKY